MAGYEATAVVQVYEADAALGSGYELGNGRVLTARHVVGDRAKVTVRRESQARKDGVPMEVAWSGEAEVDVAVLRPVGSENELVGPPIVSLFVGDHRGRPWSARGFPAVLTFGRAVAVSGTVQAAQGSQAMRELAVSTHPPKPEDWRGVSGAAVFVELDHLFGVLHSASGYMPGALKAVPVAELLRSHEELRAAVGLSTLADRRVKVLDALLFRLRADPKLGFYLGKGAPSWGLLAADPIKLASAIVDEGSPLAVAKAFNRAMYEVTEGSGRAEVAESMRVSFEQVLPFVVGSCVGSHGCPESGELATSHPQVVEAHLAWERDGSMRMRAPQNTDAYPVPEGYVEIYSDALPEDGMDPRGRLEAIVENIATHSPELVRGWFQRDTKGGIAYDRWERELKIINAKLGAIHGVLFFAITHCADQVSEQEFIAQLRSKLDAVRVIVPRVSTEQGEDADHALMANIGQFYRYYYSIIGSRS